MEKDPASGLTAEPLGERRMSVRHGLGWALGNQYLSLGLQFIASIALARILGPTEIGIYSVMLASVVVIQVLRDFGLSTYLIKADEPADDIIRTVFTIGFILSLAMGAALYAASPAIAHFYGEDRMVEGLRLLSLNFLILPFTAPFMALLRRQMRFDTIFRVSFASNVVMIAVSVSLALAGAGFLSMVYGTLAQSLMLAILVHASAGNVRMFRPSFAGWRPALGFGSSVSATHAVGELGMMAPDLIMGKVLGFAPTALFSRAQGMTKFIQQPLISSISSVFLPELSNVRRAGGAMQPMFSSKIAYLAALLWPANAMLAVLSEPIILLLFGADWMGAAPILRILAIAGLTVPFTALNADFLFASDRPNAELRLRVVTTITRISLVLFACTISLEAVAWVIVLNRLLTVAYYRQLLGGSLRFLSPDAIRPLAAAVTATGAVLCAALFVHGIAGASAPSLTAGRAAVEIAAAALLAAPLWAATLFVMGHPLAREIARIAKRSRTAQLH